jgi:hypothetical protein
MKIYTFKILLAVLVLLKPLHGAEDKNQKSNLQAFQECYRSMIRSALQECDLDITRPLVLRNLTEQDINWLIEEQIFQWAHDSHFQSVFKYQPNQTSPAPTGYLIEYSSVSNSLQYDKCPPTTKHRVIRKIQSELHLALTGADKGILVSQTLSFAFHDTVNVKEIHELENPRYPFTIAPYKRSLYFEPLLVSIVTGTIIYFFYSFRSK